MSRDRSATPLQRDIAASRAGVERSARPQVALVLRPCRRGQLWRRASLVLTSYPPAGDAAASPISTGSPQFRPPAPLAVGSALIWLTDDI